ncbi:MAG: hypothetical protein ACE5KZ_00580 [Candidatus Scalinduaceae bacterium]
MIINSIQADYGGFNPKYVGVVIRVADQNSCNWLDRAGSITENEILSLSPVQAFDALSMVSVCSHEVRHFHDFLIAPYSQMLWRLRMVILFNGVQTLGHLIDMKNNESFNCIPVPISSWSRYDYHKRQSMLKHLSDLRPLKNGLHYRPCTLPFFTLDNSLLKLAKNETLNHFDRLIAVTMHYYQMMRNFTFRPPKQSESVIYQPCHIFELSGLICQMQTIWSDLGKQSLQRFQDIVFKELNVPYIILYRALLNIWHRHNKLMPLEMASAIVFWSLMGSYEDDKWRACPTFRFAAIHNYLLKAGPPNGSSLSIQLFDDWSDITNLSKVNKAFKHGLREADKFPKMIEKVFPLDLAWANLFDKSIFLKFIKNVCDAQKHMINIFLENPETYIDPSKYNNSCSKYVNPPVRQDFIKGGVLIEKNFESRGEVVYRGFENDQGLQIAQSFSRSVTLSKIKFIDAQEAHNIFILTSMIDQLFYDQNRDDPDVVMAQRLLQEEVGVFPFNVDI